MSCVDDCTKLRSHCVVEQRSNRGPGLALPLIPLTIWSLNLWGTIFARDTGISYGDYAAVAVVVYTVLNTSPKAFGWLRQRPRQLFRSVVEITDKNYATSTSLTQKSTGGREGERQCWQWDTLGTRVIMLPKPDLVRLLSLAEARAKLRVRSCSIWEEWLRAAYMRRENGKSPVLALYHKHTV